MSLEDQASASQETIWDFDMDAVAGLSTNTLKICGIIVLVLYEGW